MNRTTFFIVSFLLVTPLPLIYIRGIALKKYIVLGVINSLGPDELFTGPCKVHTGGRDYSKYPIVIYKNATIWNTHTPRNLYLWVSGLPWVNCEIPCILTWNEAISSKYTDVYFWGHKPGNRCDNHSLNFYSSMESPARFPYESVDNLRKAGYDISATIDQNSDVPLSYLSVKTIKKLKASKVYPKCKNCTVAMFVSNCRSKYRLEYAKGLMNNSITVHSFGGCLHNKEVKETTSKRKAGKSDVISHYKFTLAFENSVYKDYVSEKVYHALLAGSVPIYYGAVNIAEFVPKNSVIDARKFSGPKEMAEYIRMLDSNEEEYNKYHEWRKDFYKSIPNTMKERANVKTENMLCNLCIRAADINRMRYGLEKIPESKRWKVDTSNDPDRPGKKKKNTALFFFWLSY